MALLKNGFFLVFACSILFLTSCKKDCTAPIIDENIVGTWTESFSSDEVEFKADGTLIDENDALLGVGDSTSTKTYEITSEGVEMTAVADGGGGSLTFAFSIEGNECDEIKLGVFGFTSTLKRK